MSETCDFLIIGAGPAGSSLATWLARAGFAVVLLDRKRFPRPKPCGEFLSPECAPALRDLGVLDRLEARGARKIAGMRIRGYGRRAMGLYRDIGPSIAPALHGFALRREILDQELVEAAAAHPGVDFREGWTCRELLRDERSHVVGARAVHASGEIAQIEAHWTVGADGVRSFVARELGVQRRMPWLDKLALTTRYRGVPELGTAELHVFPGGYFAATPVEDQLFSLNLVIDRLALRNRERDGDWDSTFASYLERAPELAERMQAARRTSPVRGVGPLAFRTTRQAADGAALVGDACGYVDPITGDGIYYALRGAQLLACDLIAARQQGDTTRRALRRYERERRLEIGTRLWLSQLLQRGLHHQGLASRALAALEQRPGLADLLVSFAGDYVRLRDLLRPSVWQLA